MAARMWRVILVLAACGALAACARPSVPAGPSAGGTPSPSASAASEGSPAADAPDLARIVCDADGTHVLTPEVRPRRDGVHFEVDNRLGVNASFSERAAGGGSGNGAPPGISRPEGDGTNGGWSIPPGDAEVRCLRTSADGGSPGWQPITVVDPAGLYTPDIPSCTDGRSTGGYFDYLTNASGIMGDPVDIARAHFKGVRSTDLAHGSGYPGQASPHVSIVRDGRVIATAEMISTLDGGWLVSSTTFCSADLQGG